MRSFKGAVLRYSQIVNTNFRHTGGQIRRRCIQIRVCSVFHSFFQIHILMDASQKEIEILENIYHSQPNVRQRDLAHVAGLSLGMTNAILKRLAQKGWITMRKVNSRNISYAVSPEGMEVIMRKSYHYFRRTIKNVVYYRRTIEELIREISELGYQGLVLVGKSELDFIVEHACRRYGVRILKEDPEEQEGVFLLYSENYIPDEEEKEQGRGYLQKVLVEM